MKITTVAAAAAKSGGEVGGKGEGKGEAEALHGMRKGGTGQQTRQPGNNLANGKKKHPCNVIIPTLLLKRKGRRQPNSLSVSICPKKRKTVAFYANNVEKPVCSLS